MGKERTTAPHRPFRKILEERFETRAEARNREKYLKSGIGKEWLKGKFADVVELVDTHDSKSCEP